MPVVGSQEGGECGNAAIHRRSQRNPRDYAYNHAHVGIPFILLPTGTLGIICVTALPAAQEL